jgi:hypothetical protein
VSRVSCLVSRVLDFCFDFSEYFSFLLLCSIVVNLIVTDHQGFEGIRFGPSVADSELSDCLFSVLGDFKGVDVNTNFHGFQTQNNVFLEVSN